MHGAGDLVGQPDGVVEHLVHHGLDGLEVLHQSHLELGLQGLGGDPGRVGLVLPGGPEVGQLDLEPQDLGVEPIDDLTEVTDLDHLVVESRGERSVLGAECAQERARGRVGR